MHDVVVQLSQADSPMEDEEEEGKACLPVMTCIAKLN